MAEDDYGICANCKSVVNTKRDKVCPACGMNYYVPTKEKWWETVLGIVVLIAVIYGIYSLFS